MKQITFMLLAVFAICQVASATTLRDVRLQYKSVPLSDTYVGEITTINIYDDGEVERYDCVPQLPVVCDPKSLGHYASHTMERIDRLIEQARNGKIVKRGGAAFCLRAPDLHHRFTADNDEVFLYNGHICTFEIVNTSPAATSLVQMMEKILRQSSSR